jgi:hypothetical protein
MEQWLDNSACAKNASSAILDIPLHDVALDVASENKELGKPFAVVRPASFPVLAGKLGDKFEADLFENDSSKAIELLKEAGIIASSLNLKLGERSSGGTSQDYLDESVKMLKKFARSDENTGWLINGFRIPARVLPPESHFEIDALIVVPEAEGKQRLIVGEVKVYPDKAGRTPGHKIANTRAQAGLYIYILTTWLTELLAEIPELETLSVDPRGVLFFADVVDNTPRIAEFNSLEQQWQRSDVAINSITKLHEELLESGMVNGSNSQDKMNFIKSQPHKFVDGCWAGCPMAETCFMSELERGSTIALGDVADRQLSGISLSRVVELSEANPHPRGDAEEDLVSRFLDGRFPELGELKWK